MKKYYKHVGRSEYIAAQETQTVGADTFYLGIGASIESNGLYHIGPTMMFAEFGVEIDQNAFKEAIKFVQKLVEADFQKSIS
jgi:hypothetical protein